MSFPAYPQYRPTDISWIDLVPSHWGDERLKNLFTLMKRPTRERDGIVTAFRDGQVALRSRRREDGFTNAVQEIGYQGVRAGDLVIHAMDAFAGAIGVSEDDGKSSPVYSVCAPVGAVVARYYGLLIRHMALSGFINALAKGVRERSTEFRWADASVQRFPVPPVSEQQEILSFLDRETAKIDALVEEQRRLIALLKEKRQAVISHAVTKGLNPDAPMKDSGVEWLGEMPAHWEAMPLKRLINLVTSGPRGWSDFITDEGAMFFQSQNIGTQMATRLPECARINVPFGPDAERSRLREQDLVVCITGARTGAVAVVEGLQEGTYVNQHVCLARPDHQKASARYLAYCLFSEVGQKQLALAMYGLKQGLSLGDIRDVVVGVPGLEEQNEIVANLDMQSLVVDELEIETEKALSLLAERRSALISAAVTGKIDVRGTAEVLWFPFGRARARGLIATEIIERSTHQATFGRVKFQKIAYLAEAHIGVSELKGVYLREAAGPLDKEMIGEMEREAGALTGIRTEQPGGPGTVVTYRLSERRGTHRTEVVALLGERAPKLDKLIEDIGTLDTKGAEAVATLYAVWNDALIDGEAPSDMEIKLALLSEWHPEKAQKFRIDELQIWLDWMRRHDIVPAGTGPKTSTGRLFA